MRGASVLRLVMLALLWGSSFLFIKVAVEGVSPVQLVLARLALGALVLLALVGIRRAPMPRDAWMWGHLAVAAVVGNIVPYFLFAGASSAAWPQRWRARSTRPRRCSRW